MVEHSPEPQSWNEMIQSGEKSLWLAAAQEEMSSLLSMNTWELVPRTKGTSIVKCRWIFKKKLDANGNVDRYKARLVAKGFTQKKGIDFKETFSPVVRFETLRFLFATAAAQDWEIHQMDVKTAFLNGDLEETIYMEQPEGFTQNPNLVCKLKKSLYGLKQSPRCWNAKFKEFIQKHGLNTSAADPCLFICRQNQMVAYIGLYVDDLLITGDLKLVLYLKTLLAKQFDMKDLGLVKHILGIEVIRTPEAIYLSQSHYIKTVLEKFGMTDCKPLATPAVVDHSHDGLAAIDSTTPYLEAVGSLNFLATRTRPDISFAVGQVAQRMHDPRVRDWQAVKRILRYLQQTLDLKLKYSCTASPLVGYSDASYAPEAIDRKSTSGYIFLINGAAVSWRSKKQSIIALSSMEAEYISLCDAAKEGIWLSRLSKDFGFSVPLTILEDNQSTIKTAQNEIFNERSKHIDVRYHFIREMVNLKQLDLVYCPTTDMIADALTKPLERVKLEKFRSMMGLC